MCSVLNTLFPAQDKKVKPINLPVTHRYRISVFNVLFFLPRAHTLIFITKSWISFSNTIYYFFQKFSDKKYSKFRYNTRKWKWSKWIKQNDQKSLRRARPWGSLIWNCSWNRTAESMCSEIRDGLDSQGHHFLGALFNNSVVQVSSHTM